MDEPTTTEEIRELCECIQVIIWNLSNTNYDRAHQKSLMVQHLARIEELRESICAH